jgi:WD40 repeat protein
MILFLSVSNDTTIRIFNIKTKEQIKVITAATDWIYSVILLDEKRIVTGGEDRGLLLFEGRNLF